MPTFSNNGVALIGISACVPKDFQLNTDNPIFDSQEDAIKFIDTTGVLKRHIVGNDTCTSDLTFKAAVELIKKLSWQPADIGILICVTQTPDYHGPMNSTILQDRLGLSKSTIAFDIPVGCSGYVYGTSVITALMKSIGINKGLLLVGDTLSKQASPKDKSTQPLFGDAGTATAFELTNNEADIIYFDLGNDGSGYTNLYIKDGGYRNPFNENSLKYVKGSDGLERNGCHTIMEGMDVFSFGISVAPKTVKNVLAFSGLTVENLDAAIFHQANKFMNEMIRKKLKLQPEQVPYSIEKYGNTSSATIPLTIVSELSNSIQTRELNLLMCGFGIGLSWGTMALRSKCIICTEVFEL
jgi:3-oxoacyl-[acyl-carrier-protein] synthase III